MNAIERTRRRIALLEGMWTANRRLLHDLEGYAIHSKNHRAYKCIEEHQIEVAAELAGLKQIIHSHSKELETMP